jgi:hypothetical protein
MLKRINEWRSQREQSEKWVSKVLAFVLFFRITYDCCNDCHADETHYSVECAPPLRLEEDPLFVPLQSRIAGAVLVESGFEVVIAFGVGVGQGLLRLRRITRVAWREWEEGAEKPEQRAEETKGEEQDLPVSAAVEQGVE